MGKWKKTSWRRRNKNEPVLEEKVEDETITKKVISN